MVRIYNSVFKRMQIKNLNKMKKKKNRAGYYGSRHF